HQDPRNGTIRFEKGLIDEIVEHLDGLDATIEYDHRLVGAVRFTRSINPVEQVDEALLLQLGQSFGDGLTEDVISRGLEVERVGGLVDVVGSAEGGDERGRPLKDLAQAGASVCGL